MSVADFALLDGALHEVAKIKPKKKKYFAKTKNNKTERLHRLILYKKCLL